MPAFQDKMQNIRNFAASGAAGADVQARARGGQAKQKFDQWNAQQNKHVPAFQSKMQNLRKYAAQGNAGMQNAMKARMAQRQQGQQGGGQAFGQQRNQLQQQMDRAQQLEMQNRNLGGGQPQTHADSGQKFGMQTTPQQGGYGGWQQGGYGGGQGGGSNSPWGSYSPSPINIPGFNPGQSPNYQYGNQGPQGPSAYNPMQNYNPNLSGVMADRWAGALAGTQGNLNQQYGQGLGNALGYAGQMGQAGSNQIGNIMGGYQNAQAAQNQAIQNADPYANQQLQNLYGQLGQAGPGGNTSDIRNQIALWETRRGNTANQNYGMAGPAGFGGAYGYQQQMPQFTSQNWKPEITHQSQLRY